MIWWLNSYTWLVPTLNKHFPTKVGGHSMCAGGATALAEASLPPHIILAMGCWSTEAFQIYICRHPVPSFNFWACDQFCVNKHIDTWCKHICVCLLWTSIHSKLGTAHRCGSQMWLTACIAISLYNIDLRVHTMTLLWQTCPTCLFL